MPLPTQPQPERALMLELIRDTGSMVYIAPSHVVTVMPVRAGGLSSEVYADIVISVGPHIKVRGTAKQIAEKVSKALEKVMQ